jgi:hypothetical protein
MARKQNVPANNGKDMVTISKITLPTILDDWTISQKTIDLPRQAGVLDAVYSNQTLFVWIEHTTNAPTTPAVIKIIPAGIKWEYCPSTQLVATFIKNMELFGVYIYMP